jgi:hypothetical protein
MRAAVNRPEAAGRSSARVIADRPFQCRWGKFDEYKTAATAGRFDLRDPERARRESKPCLSPWFCPLSRRRAPVPRTPGGSGRAVLPCSGSSWAMTGGHASRRSHISIESRRVQPRTIARRWLRGFDERSPISSHRLNQCAYSGAARAVRKASADDHLASWRALPARWLHRDQSGAAARASCSLLQR